MLGLMKSGKLYKKRDRAEVMANCDKLKLARPILHIPLCPLSLEMIRFLYSRHRTVPSTGGFYDLL